MLFLDRQDVVASLPMTECIAAVERTFAAHASAALPTWAGVPGAHVGQDGFHVKAVAPASAPGYLAAKINANFPGNPDRHGPPTVQGMIGLFDTATGRPLALLVSTEITTLRTAAASAIAVRFPARTDATTLPICGCGNQDRAHLRAMLLVRRLRQVLAHDRKVLVTADDIRPGRSSDDQIFVFDSTGTAVQDVAAAAAVYERARAKRRGRELSLDGALMAHV